MEYHFQVQHASYHYKLQKWVVKQLEIYVLQTKPASRHQKELQLQIVRNP